MTRDETSRGARQPARPRAARPARGGEAEEAAAPKTGRQRIAKLMARVGLCSRRDAETWVLEGRVSLNGSVLTSPAVDVGPSDEVLVDGAPLPATEKTRLFLFHKPAGLITSDHDPEGRETVHDYLRQNWPDGPRVVTIGRLDYNTEGLLLLTNDGGLARLLELPRTGWVRRYRVRAKGETNQAVLDGLRTGVSVEGVDYAGIEAKLDRIQGANCWLTMGLREGKNREVKRVLEHVGLEVNRLIRLSFGPFQLLDLPEGAVEEVKTRVLREQLGPTLAEAAGVDFGDSEAVATIVAPPPGSTRAPAGSNRAAAGKIAPGRDRPARENRPDRSDDRRPAPRSRDGRDSRDGRAREEAPALPPEKRERPVSGPRRHVSALRAETGAASKAGPRRRVERTDTADRKNRTVAVERLVPRNPVAASREGGERRARRSAGDGASLARPKRESQSAQGKRERIARSGAPREDRGAPERPRVSPGERPSRSSEHKPRGDRSGGGRSEARREARPSRSEGDARAPRRSGDRLSRAGGGAPGDRPPRGRAERPPATRGAKNFGEGWASGRPPRAEKTAAPRGAGRSPPRGGSGKPARTPSSSAPRDRPTGGARPPRGPRR